MTDPKDVLDMFDDIENALENELGKRLSARPRTIPFEPETPTMMPAMSASIAPLGPSRLDLPAFFEDEDDAPPTRGPMELVHHADDRLPTFSEPPAPIAARPTSVPPARERAPAFAPVRATHRDPPPKLLGVAAARGPVGATLASFDWE